jgi:Methyltransferase domain
LPPGKISFLRCVCERWHYLIIAEVGVADGVFSEYLLNELRPRKFVAFDLFALHEADTYGGAPTNVLLKNMTHLDYYRRKFADRASQVVTGVGRSNLTLAKYPDKTFDLIYIDVNHSYESVRQDTNIVQAKLADDGILVLDDYTQFDFIGGVRYGIVRAVNELIINQDWQVCGFSLQRAMFCNIAIRKSSGSSR